VARSPLRQGAALTLDEQLFIAANHALSGPWATPVLAAITWLGNGAVLAALVLPALYLLDRERLRRHAVALVVSVTLSGLAVNAAKAVLDVPRPADRFPGEVLTPTGTPVDGSMPSGHAQTAFGTAAYLSCLYPAAAPVLLALACLVGLSRVALGVHTPLEVLVGAGAGAATSLLGYQLNVLRLRSRKRSR
jgi:membrane-associated phospholipid phosphatase